VTPFDLRAGFPQPSSLRERLDATLAAADLCGAQVTVARLDT